MSDEMKRTHVNWPNYLVIGAGKPGATALHHYLRQHPDI